MVKMYFWINKKLTMKITVLKVTILLFSMGALQTVMAQKTPAKVAVKTKPVVMQTKTKNKIQITSSGFKVKEAYLVFDDGTHVPDDNKVDVEQRINMVLIIDEGWKVTDSLVYPGASEKILSSNGSVILNEDDLFKSYEETGVSAADARYITLKAVITKIDNKKNSIIVKFRVWDKKGTSSLTGYYRFFIK